MRRLGTLLVLATALLGAAYVAPSGRYRVVFLSPRDVGVSGFGYSVAAAEDRIVVGVENENAAAFIFEADGGRLVKVLTEPDRGPYDTTTGFGEVVAAGGGRVAIAARWTRRVYIYDLDGVLGQVLENPLPEPDPTDYIMGFGFGVGVAVDRDTVVVGGAREGTYVFRRESSVPLLLTTDRASGREAFGSAVAIAGQLVIVGDQSTGIVDAFDRGSGSLRWSRRFRARTVRLAATDDTVAIGGASTPSGRKVVLLLDAATGSLLRRFRAPRNGGFGASLALSDAWLVVGSPEIPHMEEVGAAFVYRVKSGALRATLRLGRDERLRTGWSVAVTGDRIVVGARDDSGHVAVFSPRSATRR